MRKKWNRYIASIVILSLLGCGSLKEAKVIITKEYVINPNWDKVDNAFTVTKMKDKNRLGSVNVTEATVQKLLQGLVKDTTFSFTANVTYNGEKYSKRKVYFNENNGFVWWDDINVNLSKNVLGVLQTSTWYFLGGLGEEKTLYYVYLDSIDSLHTFRVPASAWTNY